MKALRRSDLASEVVHDLLEQWADGYAAACREHPTHPKDAERSSWLDVGRRGIGEDEASAFLKAWEAGLLTTEADGHFHVVGAKECSDKLHLVGRLDTHVALHTEYLVQVGAYGELVLDHDWPAERLSFECGALDLHGHDDSGRVVLAVEAKARANGPGDTLEHLLTAFRSRAADPDAPLPAPAERKWTELVRLAAEGPVLLWLVADSARWLWRVERDGERVALTDIGGLPTYERV